MQKPDISQAIAVIQDQENDFNAMIASHNAVDFKSELSYAIQHLKKNEHLLSVALKNPDSLKYAISNVGSIGISLCPAKKQAYLVPRKGEVILDISYMGFCYMAIDSGGISWVQAEIIRTSDIFILKGAGQMPIHEYDPMSIDRGEIKGAYCIAKTPNGDYLTTVMRIDEIYTIRNRSDGFKAWKNKKASSTVWVTDETEMIKKTVLRRAYKLWPTASSSSRMAKAIQSYDATHGINFDDEVCNDEVCTPEQVSMIKNFLKVLNRDEISFIEYFEKEIHRKDFTINTLTLEEADKAIIALRDIIDRAEFKKNVVIVKKENVVVVNEDDSLVEF